MAAFIIVDGMTKELKEAIDKHSREGHAAAKADDREGLAKLAKAEVEKGGFLAQVAELYDKHGRIDTQEGRLLSIALHHLMVDLQSAVFTIESAPRN